MAAVASRDAADALYPELRGRAPQISDMSSLSWGQAVEGAWAACLRCCPPDGLVDGF